MRFFACAYEDAVRGLGTMGWSETESGKGADQFLTCVYRVMNSNCTGAGYATVAWDGGPTNETEKAMKLLHFLSDARAGIMSYYIILFFQLI